MIIKTKKLNKASLILVLVLSVVFVATPAFAQTTTPKTKGTANISKMIERSDTAITQRINSLNALVTRVNSMQKLSDTEKSTLATSLQNEVSQLTTLKATIDADTVATTLKTDMQSITKSYRIYMLVLPQASIAAASDRVLTIVGLMNGVETKLATRISQVPSTANITSIQSAMSDITAKLSDATTQASAAVSETASLVPDQGNTITVTSNTAALKDARSKIKTATADLTAARKDFATVVQGIKALGKISVTQ
jgi:hypothetical protein